MVAGTTSLVGKVQEWHDSTVSSILQKFLTQDLTLSLNVELRPLKLGGCRCCSRLWEDGGLYGARGYSEYCGFFMITIS